MNFRIFKQRLWRVVWIMWAIWILWISKLSFYFSVSQCDFPIYKNSSKILIIADPQLTDFYSYKQSGPLLELTQFFSDVFMKKSFKILVGKFRPDIIIFLGDLMDGGREISLIQDYKWELDRFNFVFSDYSQKTLKYFMAGNHDIGIQIIPQAYDRFVENFSSLNRNITIGNTNFVLLDSIGLLADKDSMYFKNSIEFLNQGQSKKNVLFTHIPLYRQDNLDCGSLRRNKPIRQGRGYQYVNLIPQKLSQDILMKIKPVLIFSGDDHDDCVYTHNVNSQKFIEHTLPTFSWLQGNYNPGYGIMVLNHLQDSDEIFSRTCLLPSQMGMYLYTIFFFMMTLILFCIRFGKFNLMVPLRLIEDEYELLPTNSRNLQNKRVNQGCKIGSLIRLMLFILVFYFTVTLFDYYT